MALIPGSAARKSGSCLGPEGFAIMKTSQNQTAAKAFLNWWISTKAQKLGMLEFDQFPIYSSMYSDPQLRRLVAKADGVDDFAIYGAQFNYAQARPNFPGYLDASQKLQVHLHKAFLGSETPQKALDAAAAQMRAASGGGNNP
jgi:multiple sugar transport system substrate-binding protein